MKRLIMFLAAGVVSACACADDLVRLTHGNVVADYATFSDALSAAVAGDTLTLLGDIDVGTPRAPLFIGKSVSVDLGGHRIFNEDPDYSFNLIWINGGAQVNFRNGTLHSRWQSVIVPNSDNSSVTLTDCVVSGNGVTWSGRNNVSVTIGEGCKVTCTTLTFGGASHRVVVEGGEIYSSTLSSGGGTLVVTGGRFAADPSMYIVGNYKATPESRTTSYGTTSYVIEASTEFAAVVKKAGSGDEQGYATVAAAFMAAANGDTVVLHEDWVRQESTPFNVAKAVTIDLGGHAISNTVSANLLDVQATPVVFKNGTLSAFGQSAIVFNNGVQTAYMTNCLVTGSVLSYGSYAGELHVGAGCRFTCRALASAYYNGSSGSRVNVFLDDDDIVCCCASGLFDSSSSALSHVYVRGGKFSFDPSASVVGARKAVAQQNVTDIGPCSYVVADRTGAETVVAEAVFPNGEAVICETLASAVSAARIGDKVRFLADVDTAGEFSLGKRLVYDLNGHTFRETTGSNFIKGNTDGCVFLNGTLQGTSQSILVPGGGSTLYVTNCTLKGPCGVYSGSSNARAVLSGCVLDLSSAVSGHSSCRVAVDMYDSLCTISSAWLDNGASGTSTLNIFSCRANRDPSGYLDEGSCVAEVSYTTNAVTYTYLVFPEAEAGDYDLTACEAQVGRRYCASFASAYAALAKDDTLKLLKDASVPDYFNLDKSFTLDLNGFTLSQTGDAYNFLQLQNGHTVTITGGGTVSKLDGNSALWIDGNGGTFEIGDCTFTGGNFAYGTSGTVKLLSTNAVVESSALVSSHSTCRVTVIVEKGQVKTKVWDGNNPESGSGGFVEANGGVWQTNPLISASVDAFTVGAGLIARYNPSAGTYALVAIPASFAVDVCDPDFQACSYTGSVPVEGAEVTVDFSASGDWDGRKKLLGDFSRLGNFDKLVFRVGTVPSSFGSAFALTYRNGLLYAGIRRGMVVVFK